MAASVHDRQRSFQRHMTRAAAGRWSYALLDAVHVATDDPATASMIPWVALQLALRHPSMVRKLAISSTAYDIDGYLPQVRQGLLNPDPDAFPAIIRESYERVAPKPGGWRTLVAKAGEQASAERGLTAAQLSSITAPALVMAAEHDVIRPEHARELARLLRTELMIVPNVIIRPMSSATPRRCSRISARFSICLNEWT